MTGKEDVRDHEAFAPAANLPAAEIS